MTTPADTFNTTCAAHQAATEALQKAQANRDRLTVEVEREAERFAAAEDAQNAAIEQSLMDESVIVPRLDRNALDIADRKLQAAQRVYDQAAQAERRASQQLAAAKNVFESSQGIEAGRDLLAEITKLKQVAAVLALQTSPEASAAMFDAGIRIACDPQTREMVVRFPRPRNVPSLAVAVAGALNPKAYPAAAKHYRALAEAERANGEADRKLRQAEIAQRQDAELARLEAKHAAEVATLGAVSRAAAQARYLTQRAKIAAEHMAERSRA